MLYRKTKTIVFLNTVFEHMFVLVQNHRKLRDLRTIRTSCVRSGQKSIHVTYEVQSGIFCVLGGRRKRCLHWKREFSKLDVDEITNKEHKEQ